MTRFNNHECTSLQGGLLRHLRRGPSAPAVSSLGRGSVTGPPFYPYPNQYIPCPPGVLLFFIETLFKILQLLRERNSSLWPCIYLIHRVDTFDTAVDAGRIHKVWSVPTLHHRSVGYRYKTHINSCRQKQKQKIIQMINILYCKITCTEDSINNQTS